MIKYPVLLIALCASCLFANAQSLAAEIQKYKETDNFIITVDNPVVSRIHLALKDNKSHAIWQESILFAEKVRKVLYLGSLDPGEYVMEISNAEETKAVTIQVIGKEKSVHPENGKTLVVGFSRPKADRSIDIIVQNKLNKNVFLKVFKNKTVFLEQDLGKEEVTKRIFKLPETEKGDFIVRVAGGDNVYQYKITQ